MTLPIPRNSASPFDLLAGQGQLNYSFVFKLVNASSGQFIRYLTPLMDQTPQLTHDTSQTIKRSVSLALGVSDTAVIDTIHHRVLIFLQLADGTLYPLGRFMFTDSTRIKSTGGDQCSVAMMDEGFIIDQPSETSFPSGTIAAQVPQVSASGAKPINVTDLIRTILESRPNVIAQIEDSDFLTTASWSIGTSVLQTLTDLSVYGDFFPPWINASNIFRMIRTFDPATRAPNFDWDLYPHVYADSVTESDDLLSAPNRFIVIGNAANNANTSLTTGTGAANNLNGAISGSYDVPASAPHSIQNRGFAVPLVAQMQVETVQQAIAVATSIGLQSTLYQRTTLQTFPDPRHDSYDVIRWQGDLWLELAWSMDLIAGGNMTHTLRKVYS